MRLVFISDTHTLHEKLTIPECDILVHSGDWSFQGHEHETVEFAKWLDKQPAKRIVLTSANHEKFFETMLPESRKWVTDHCPRVDLLIHEAIEIDGLKFFASPYSPTFGMGWAWNADRTIVESAHSGKPFIGDLWKDIPEDTQILVTHGPGMGILDTVTDRRTGKEVHVGCQELTNRIKDLTSLKAHVFGHIHGPGARTETIDGVIYINAAMCDDDYRITRKPIVLDL